MLILGIDSSSLSASCALVKDGKLIGEYYLNCGHTHSATLVPMINSLLSDLSYKTENLDLIAVTSGPGSFTGVRIGICTVKGLAAPFDIKTIGVSSLLASAYNMSAFQGIICPVMDARVGKVYNALFKADGKGGYERLCDDRAISSDDLCAELSGIKDDIYVTGDGADLLSGFASEKSNIHIIPSNMRFVRGYGVAIAALSMYNNENISQKSEDLLPVYLRAPQAVREREEKIKRGK